MFDDSFGAPKRKRTLNAADKKRIAAKQKWKCKICGGTLPARFNVDHIKPFADGGSDKESNLQALCGTCHDKKTEEDRHRKKQQKIKKKEREQTGGLFGGSSIFGGPEPKRRKKDSNPFAVDTNIWSPPPKKKKSKKPKGPFDIDFGL